MGLDVVRCRRCSHSLSRPLQRLELLPVRVFRDEDRVSMEATVQEGEWAVDPRPLTLDAHGNPIASLGCIVVNPADGLDLETHPDQRRSSGCCGHDGCDGPNRRCPRCHAEVATLVDDCWTVVELRFEPSAVDVDAHG